MPTYQYACTECGERLEVVQKFTDDPLTVCPACQGKLRKVFSAVGIVFKGSGFYRTDSRNGSGNGEAAKKANGDGSAASSDGSAAKPGTDGKNADGKPADSKPAAKTGKASTSAAATGTKVA